MKIVLQNKKSFFLMFDFNNINAFAPFILLILFFSCKSKPETTKNIEGLTEDSAKIYMYHYTGIIHDFDSLKFYKKQKISGRRFKIYDSITKEDITPRLLFKYQNNKLYFNDKETIFVDSFYFHFNNSTISVLKFYYDEINVIDEEADIYYNNIHGVIATFNKPWGVFEIYEPIETDGLAEVLFQHIKKNRKN